MMDGDAAGRSDARHSSSTPRVGEVASIAPSSAVAVVIKNRSTFATRNTEARAVLQLAVVIMMPTAQRSSFVWGSKRPVLMPFHCCAVAGPLNVSAGTVERGELPTSWRGTAGIPGWRTSASVHVMFPACGVLIRRTTCTRPEVRVLEIEEVVIGSTRGTSTTQRTHRSHVGHRDFGRAQNVLDDNGAIT